LLLSDRGFSLQKEHSVNQNKIKHKKTLLQKHAGLRVT